MEDDGFAFLSVEMVEPTSSQLEELELTPFVNDDALPPPPSRPPAVHLPGIRTPTEPEGGGVSRRRDEGKRVVGDSSGGPRADEEELEAPPRPNALQVIRQLERDAIRMLRTPPRRKGPVPLPRPRWQRPGGYRRKEKDSEA